MGRRSENEGEFKRQSYLRLVRYARPYWFRLGIGIVAGMVVGGSLLVSLLLIPQLIGVVDPTAADSAGKEKVVAAPSELEVRDPKLAQMLSSAEGYLRKYRIPASIEGTTLHVRWPVEASVELTLPSGKAAWPIFAAYCAVLIVAWGFKNLGTYINHYYTRWVGNKVVADMRNEVFEKLLGQSMRYYGNMDVGHLISRCTNDTSAIEHSVSETIADLTNCPLQILACLTAVLLACRDQQNYALVVILLLGVPLIVLPIAIMGRKIRKTYKSTYARIAEVMSRMHEVFTGIRVVKACHTEALEVNRFRAVNRRYFRDVVKALKLQLLLSPLMESVAVAGSLVFLVYSFSQGTTLTQLAALMAPAFLAYRPIKDLSKVAAYIQRSMAAADRYFALIDMDTSLPEKADGPVLEGFRDKIELKDVVFAYAERKILDGVSFEIPKGSMVAVVGETGSGKSTIANLIARFYDVDEGAILLDGVDVRDYRIESLRKHIGVVTQDAILFNDTIAANIAYGCPEATREEIENAARLANAHSFITDGRHADGYDSEVGDKGFRLSGGEKQRVSIARAILRNPPILILDEATSALDTVTEKLVQEALGRVMANRTVFAIAHRLSTIRHADLILVLENGKIVESGTHDALLAHGGRYRKLHDTQFSLDQ